MKTDLDNLATAAVAAATSAAHQHLMHNRLCADPDALAECIKAHVKIAFPAALRDARDAIEASMPRIAEATFLASFVLAGVEAAKEAGQPARVGLIEPGCEPTAADNG